VSDKLKKLTQSEILLPSLVLLVLLNLLFFPVIWGNSTLIHSAGDVASIMPYGAYENNRQHQQTRRSNDDGAPAWFSEPNYAVLHQDYFNRVIAPLWNSFNGYGCPLLANMQSQPFNPLVLIACIAPSPKTDDLFVLARLFLAGILTNLYLRRLIGTYGSIFGAIAFMLTGYLIIFLNMPEISVTMWLPGLLYALERLAKSSSFGGVVCGALFTAMVLFGGMPEVSFLVLLLGGFYFLARVIDHHRKWSTRSRAFIAYALTCACGLAMAAPQIFPFIEYIGQSFNAHVGAIGAGGTAGPGSVYHVNFPVHFLNYLAPLIYGPLGDAKVKSGFGYDGFDGYWGVIVFSFAILAVVAAAKNALSKDADELKKTLSPIVWFFFATVVLLLSKNFGMPLLNWIAVLPLFKLVIFWKYSQPLIGFGMAVLAGIGFDLLATGALRRQTLLIGNSLALGTLITLGLVDKHYIWGDHSVHVLFDKTLTISTALICFAVAIGVLALAKPSLRMKSCRLLLLLLCADLSLSFLLPMFYWFHQLADRRSDPYQGAPYIQYLQKTITDSQRVLGFDGVLFPNWSSAFRISDVRDLDAMYPRHYLAFVRNFLMDKEPTELADFNLTTRFNGQEKLADPLFAESDLQTLQRFWYLSSVQYLLATRDHFLGQPTEITRKILLTTKRENDHYLRLDAFTIDKQTKHVLFQHPHGDKVSDTVRYECTVDKDKPWLNFSVGLDPSVYGIAYGDGMTFSVYVSDASGETEIFRKYIDPKSVRADRHWKSESIDLSKFSGSPLTLMLRVDGGPSNNTSADWGGWADLRFSSSDKPAPIASPKDAPTLVYDKEIKIYKNRDILPRVSMFYDYALAKTDAETLRLLKSKSFNVRSTIVLDANEIDAAILPPVDTGTSPPDTQTPMPDSATPTPPRITSYSPLIVKVAVDQKRDGILMLNDQIYPGWNAYVDGKTTEIWRGDYLFRAVLVEKGQHEVIFKYEPLSFYIGACLCAITVFALSAYGFFFTKRREEHV
jgi:hypothetical protein